jgi:hypothetical protein
MWNPIVGSTGQCPCNYEVSAKATERLVLLETCLCLMGIVVCLMQGSHQPETVRELLTLLFVRREPECRVT